MSFFQAHIRQPFGHGRLPLFTVQRLLGHAQIDTTFIYAHLAEDHSAEMMAKLPY
jgi:site-specific recombinase XerD